MLLFDRHFEPSKVQPYVFTSGSIFKPDENTTNVRLTTPPQSDSRRRI